MTTEPVDTLMFFKGEEEANQQRVLKSKLELKNVHESHVLFKIKTTRPNVYMVRPTSGSLPPNTSMAVEIIYYGQTSTVD